MLLSFLNLKLRDFYSSPREMCDDQDWNYDDFIELISSKGISYSDDFKRFVMD
ncbi:MAG: DUF4250 domain-containing protein [Lachnoclostridium sp.]|nr:DUF4250 domain-containing protein [Lachnoclostridium sp.]